MVLDEVKQSVSCKLVHVVSLYVNQQRAPQKARKQEQHQCHHVPFPKNPFFRGLEDAWKAMQAHLGLSLGFRVSRASPLFVLGSIKPPPKLLPESLEL